MKKHRIRILPFNGGRYKVEVLELRKFWFIRLWICTFTTSGGLNLMRSYAKQQAVNYGVPYSEIEELNP